MIGENSPRFAYKCIPISTHAEIDALLKVKSEYAKTKQRNPMKMDLMVIRFSKTGIINNAEPCLHCIRQLAQATYVNIGKIYFSTSSSTIMCKKFTDMLRTPTTFISSGWRKYQHDQIQKKKR